MDHEVGPWKMAFLNGRLHGPTSMVRLLKELVLKALGPSLGVNQMWTKKNDHAPKREWVDVFLINAQEEQFWIFFSSLTILLSSFELHLSSLLVKCLKDVDCKSSYNNFYRKQAI